MMGEPREENRSVSSNDHLRSGTQVPVLASFFAGSCSGIVARTVTAPLDVLKIKSQLIPRTSKLRSHETRLFQLIRSVYRDAGNRGILSFYRGNVPGLVMYIIYGSVQFSSYSFINSRVQFSTSDQLQSLVVGGFSGVISSIVSYPCDVVRTRFVATLNTEKTGSSSHRAPSMLHTLREIWMKEGGVFGVFKGCSSSIVSVAMSTSIIFSVYETLKIYCETHENTEYLNAMSSSITGVVAKTVTFPLDTVRRRIQIMSSRDISKYTNASSSYKEYNLQQKFLKVSYLIYKKEGIRAFYQGLTMGLLKSAPTTAISLTVYEYVLSRLV